MGVAEQQLVWSVRMADMVLESHPDLSDQWSHEYGVVFKALEDVWIKTKDDKYFDYIQTNMERRIEKNGHIDGYEMDDYSLDHINTGRLLFTLYEKTGDDRYKKAAYVLRDQFKSHPRTSEGVFWHKQIFPYQAFLDGIYMGSPFYAQFAQLFDDPEAFDDVVNQVAILAKHTKDHITGLHFHGWDEKKEQIWADPESGRSPSFWGRALGWYGVGIVDILDYLPEEHPGRGRLIEILNGLIEAVINVQDEKTGVWYQIIDQGGREGNYLESSASCMFTYTLAKGMRKGYLPGSLLPVLNRAYNGIIDQFIEVTDKGNVMIHQTCQTAGLGITSNRDGSFAYYISEPISSNDFKGIGTFIMASVEVERIQERFKGLQ